MVKVIHENESGWDVWFPKILERCVFCDEETRCWWRDGCMPVCRSCAEKTTITADVCINLAKKEGYGPL